jgi:murein DD-endopeptidase MepM/ murein hydrolase activator NlpD
VVRSDIFSGFGSSSQRSSGIHQGVDYEAAVGSAVSAVDDGRVVLSGTSSSWGEYVVVAHQNASGEVVSYTAYMHLSQRSVSVGDRVSSGSNLGLSGDTGNARGGPEHLHFEIWTSLDAAQRGSGLNHRRDPSKHLPEKKAKK